MRTMETMVVKTVPIAKGRPRVTRSGHALEQEMGVEKLMTIGRKIRLLRKRSGETQVELADALQVSKPCVCHWEHERQQPNAYAIRELCKHYQVSADWLLGLTEEKSTLRQ